MTTRPPAGASRVARHDPTRLPHTVPSSAGGEHGHHDGRRHSHDVPRRRDPWLFGNHPMSPPPVPPDYRWSLGLVYVVFAIVIALLYYPCKWYGDVKRRDKTGVLKYI